MEKQTNCSKGLKNQEIILKELLAKSLILFIGVGMISGLALGVYLLDVKNTNQLIFVEGPSISVVTEKIDFKVGEEIKIRIVNSGTIPMFFSDASYGLKITTLAGIMIYSPISIQVISELEPGDEIETSWNQIKNDGNSALEGLYKISTKAKDPQGNKIDKSTIITIWK
ncbi:MAG: hypothetical protein QQN62_01755 [Nitrosopumilus sp.]